MLDLFDSLFTDEIDTEFDIALDIINQTQGHADFNQLCKYYDINAYNKLLYKTSNCFTIMHLNTRSITNKLDTITALLHTLHKRPSVIVVTETWLNDLNCNLFNIPGYTPYHLVSIMRAHGGVSVYVSNKLESSQIKKSSFINEQIEINSVKITYGSKSYVVCGLYRPHSKDEFVDEFTDMIAIGKPTINPNIIALITYFISFDI